MRFDGIITAVNSKDKDSQVLRRRAEARRLEGWATNAVLVPMLRDALLRSAPQHEVGVVEPSVLGRL
jgi:hypothetical protein